MTNNARQTASRNYPLLQEIDSPENLNKLSIEQLTKVAEECRAYLIDMVAENGGHFGSSLGVVELTVALHHVYNTPVDKIVWDVGHQAYIHKILTGRRNLMQSNRRYNGIAGFPKMSESPHDAFGTGHASTSISAAAGMAAARDLAGGREKVVAVIGDGSMTGGMAFEAMNHLGDLKSDMLVILNDNQMAISPSTGGLKDYLINLSLNKTYNKLRQFIWNSVSLFDNQLGDTAKTMLHKLEDGIKASLTPGAFFEALGFRYFGPIDGHDMEQLVTALREIRALPHPKLLHIVTCKGKGFAPAEEHQSEWHASSGGFDPQTGKPLKVKSAPQPPKYQEVFGQALAEIARKDPNVVGITAAMPSGTSLDIFQQACPDRFFDVGIAEQHAVTFAAGMATRGFKPVCAIYSTFLQRAYDQLIHDVALQNQHVIFAIDRAGLVGEDGPTHHGAFDLSYLQPVPNMVIMAPADEQELRDMLYTAIAAHKGPVAIRYPRGNATGMVLRNGFRTIETGRGEIAREGSGVGMLAIGTMVQHALDAAEELSKEGIEPMVANMRFLKPVDRDLVRSVAATCDTIIVIEENSRIGGLGSTVTDLLSEEDYHGNVIRLGLPDEFVTHGSMQELYRLTGLDKNSIADAVRKSYKAKETEVYDSTNSMRRTDRLA